jgi:hypothetical protein
MLFTAFPYPTPQLNRNWPFFWEAARTSADGDDKPDNSHIADRSLLDASDLFGDMITKAVQ